LWCKRRTLFLKYLNIKGKDDTVRLEFLTCGKNAFEKGNEDEIFFMY